MKPMRHPMNKDNRTEKSNTSGEAAGIVCFFPIFTARKRGDTPVKTALEDMDNPNQTNLPKPPAYGFETSADGQELYLCRYRKPCWRLRLADASTPKEKLAASLRKAAEWLAKRS